MEIWVWNRDGEHLLFPQLQIFTMLNLILLKKRERGNGFQAILGYRQSNKGLEQKYFSALQL